MNPSEADSSDLKTTAILYVTYQGTGSTRFNRDYYVEHHLAVVLRSWQTYGLDSVAAFFPAQAQPGTIAICECRFRDNAAIEAAFASPEARAVMADLVHFTDIKPVWLRACAF